MLYIEKNECPGEVADDIQAIKETDAWKNTPEPLNQVLPEERSKTTRELRNFFDQLKKDKIREALLIEQHYLKTILYTQPLNIGCRSVRAKRLHWITKTF